MPFTFSVSGHWRRSALAGWQSVSDVATVELSIPAAKFDAVPLIDLIGRHGLPTRKSATPCDTAIRCAICNAAVRDMPRTTAAI